MAQDDPDFHHLCKDKENCAPALSKASEDHHTPLALADKTNLPENSSSVTTKSSNQNEESSLEVALQIAIPDDSSSSSGQDHQDLHSVAACGENMMPVCGTCGSNTNGGRWDKSLGVLCQKFVMLFLVTPVSTHMHHLPEAICSIPLRLCVAWLHSRP